MLETFTLPNSTDIIRLFRVQPDLRESPLRVEHSLRTIQTTTRTGREHGSAAYETIRHRMSAPYVLPAANADRLCEILGQLTHARVALPLWPAKRRVSAVSDSPYTSDYLLNFDASGYAFRPAAEIADYQYQYVCPLVIGYFPRPPELMAVTDQLAKVTVSILEDSPYEMRIRPNTAGLTFGDDWPSTLVPDYTEALTGVDDIIDLIDVDRGRERPVEGDEAPPRWWQEANFQLHTTAKIRTLLGFWAAKKARLRKWNTPMWFKPGEERTTTPHETVARFSSDTLTVDYLTTGFANSRVRMEQLPWEHLGLPNAGGEQETIVYLFEFNYKVPGPVQWRFTNHERDVQESDDVVWTTYPSMEVTRPQQQMGIDKEVWKFSCYAGDGHPLMLAIPFNLEAPLEIRVYEANPDAPQSKSLEFRGDVVPGQARGRKITFEGRKFGGVLDRKLPTFFIQRRCNYQVFSGSCGLNEGNYRRLVTITAISQNSVTVSGIEEADGHWEGGRLYAGLGLDYESRPIVGQVGSMLNVMKPLRKHRVGDKLWIVPGCDGSPEKCKEYGNFQRFGGFPGIPEMNHTTSGMAAAASEAKK